MKFVLAASSVIVASSLLIGPAISAQAATSTVAFCQKGDITGWSVVDVQYSQVWLTPQGPKTSCLEQHTYFAYGDPEGMGPALGSGYYSGAPDTPFAISGQKQGATWTPGQRITLYIEGYVYVAGDLPSVSFIAADKPPLPDPAEFTAAVTSVDSESRSAIIGGTATPGTSIRIGGRSILVQSDGQWSLTITGLAVGPNSLLVEQIVDGAVVGQQTVTAVVEQRAHSTNIGVYHLRATPDTGEAFAPDATGTVSFASQPDSGTVPLTVTTGQALVWSVVLPKGLTPTLPGDTDNSTWRTQFKATPHADGSTTVTKTVTLIGGNLTDAGARDRGLSFGVAADADLVDGAPVTAAFTPVPNWVSTSPAGEATVHVAAGPTLAVTNPADPTVGYTPNTAFTFRGVAKKDSGTVSITNFQGTPVATVPVDPATGAWEWTRANMGRSIWKLTFSGGNETVTLGDFAPSTSTPAPELAVTNPADPSAGYIANTPFTFRGEAKKDAGTVSIVNFNGTPIATVPVDPGTGAWSWTRANMGTSVWKLTFSGGGEEITLGDFAPRA